MNELELKALAKINLGLDVLGKREDGYHEVKMVMQTIYLHDRIYMKKIRTPKIKVRTNLFYLPENENNLVYKAAHLLREEFSLPEGIFIQLKKHIPVAAGLAGGSSDCAAVLFGMNRMYRLGLSLEDLMERGVTLGADVPYCLMRGTALAEGIGEKLTALPPMPRCKVLIAKPPISVSTRMVYENLNLENISSHLDMEGVLGAIEGGDLKALAGSMGNILESVTISRYPIIEEIKNKMKKHGALNAMMSGSGPTVFGLFDKESSAKAAFQALRRKDEKIQVYLTDVYNNRVPYSKGDSSQTTKL